MQSPTNKDFKKEFTARLVGFSVETLKFSEILKKNRILWPVADQLVRSATSIGANVVEARGASSRRDYLRFFEIALKSAYETQYWLIVLSHYDKTNATKTNKLLKEAEELAKVISSAVLTMKGRKK